jgi:hypothetical protein
MHIVAIHRITDPDKFFSMDPEEVTEGGPPDVHGRQFFPAKGSDRAVCLWEADTVASLRNYLDPATQGAAENDYFEVDADRAMGLREVIAARA